MEQKTNLTHELIERIGLYLQSKFHDLGGFFDYLIHRNNQIDSRLNRIEEKIDKILSIFEDKITETEVIYKTCKNKNCNKLFESKGKRLYCSNKCKRKVENSKRTKKEALNDNRTEDYKTNEEGSGRS